MTILVISMVFFLSKKNYFNHKNFQNIRKPLIRQNVEKGPLRTAKITKMPHKYPKYSKTLEIDQNAPKTTTIRTETFKTTKIPLNPQNKQSTLETFFTLCRYFGRFQVSLLILEDFMTFCMFQQCQGVYFNYFRCLE